MSSHLGGSMQTVSLTWWKDTAYLESKYIVMREQEGDFLGLLQIELPALP